MKNEGKADRVIRVVIGIVLLSLLLIIPSNLRFIGLIGILPLITAAAGFCPVYALFHISTSRKDS
jgi:hypothetical protein